MENDVSNSPSIVVYVQYLLLQEHVYQTIVVSVFIAMEHVYQAVA